MPNIEIREGGPSGEVVSVHEGVILQARGFRTFQATNLEGFQARDVDGNVIENLAVDHEKGIGFTDSGLCLNGFALYFNPDSHDALNRFFYSPHLTFETTKQVHSWVVSFPTEQ